MENALRMFTDPCNQVKGNHNNSLTVQIETLNFPMMMERVSFAPFFDSTEMPLLAPSERRGVMATTMRRSRLSSQPINSLFDRHARFVVSIGSPLRPDTIATLRANTSSTLSRYALISRENSRNQLLETIMQPNNLMASSEFTVQTPPMPPKRPKTIPAIKHLKSAMKKSLEQKKEQGYSFNRHAYTTSSLLPSNDNPALNEKDYLSKLPSELATLTPYDFQIPTSLNDDDDIKYRRWALTSQPKRWVMGRRQTETAQTATMDDLEFVRGDFYVPDDTAESKVPSIARTYFVPHLTRTE
jgi:hypothetical protein